MTTAYFPVTIFFEGIRFRKHLDCKAPHTSFPKIPVLNKTPPLCLLQVQSSTQGREQKKARERIDRQFSR